MDFKFFNCFMGTPEDPECCMGNCYKCEDVIQECENCIYMRSPDQDGYVRCANPYVFPRKIYNEDHRFKYEFIGPELPVSNSPYPF